MPVRYGALGRKAISHFQTIYFCLSSYRRTDVNKLIIRFASSNHIYNSNKTKQQQKKGLHFFSFLFCFKPSVRPCKNLIIAFAFSSHFVTDVFRLLDRLLHPGFVPNARTFVFGWTAAAVPTSSLSSDNLSPKTHLGDPDHEKWIFGTNDAQSDLKLAPIPKQYW